MFLMVFVSIVKVKNGHLISKIRNNTATYIDLVENALEVRGQGDFNIEMLQNLLKFSFLTSDGFQESEHGSQEANFYNNFASLIGRNENKVLMSLVQRLESFEDY